MTGWASTHQSGLWGVTSNWCSTKFGFKLWRPDRGWPIAVRCGTVSFRQMVGFQRNHRFCYLWKLIGWWRPRGTLTNWLAANPDVCADWMGRLSNGRLVTYTRLYLTGWFGGPDHSVWPAERGGYRGSLTTTRNDSDRPLIRARSVAQLWVCSHRNSDSLVATHTRLSITFVIIGSGGSFPFVAGRPVRCSCGGD